MFLLAWSALPAQTSPLEELIALAREGAGAPGLKDRIAEESKKIRMTAKVETSDKKTESHK